MIQTLQTIIIRHFPDSAFIPLMNLNNFIKGRKVSIHLHENGIYALSDGSLIIHTGRRSRLARYFFGILRQCENLANDYQLKHIKFNHGDVVIDCGANNGEIGIWAHSKSLAYYAFEPEPVEAKCCDLNNPHAANKTSRKALWKENTRIAWYSKPESADSSIIETPDTEAVTYIDTTTLDDFVRKNKLERIRLLKLEAEGAEPEVLEGARSILNKVDYVAVDCGYERGPEKKHTFIEVYNILKAYNFEIVSAEFRRVVFLFKRIGTDEKAKP